MIEIEEASLEGPAFPSSSTTIDKVVLPFADKMSKEFKSENNEQNK